MRAETAGGATGRASAAVHDALAGLLEYPSEGHAARTAGLVATVVAARPESAADLAPMAELAAGRPLGDCEELFVRTFDVQGDRALEVGWQVFGEQYARGSFLVALRERMRDLGVAETCELPDHMTQVLRVLGRMSPEDARTLAESALLPTLLRVRGAVEPSNPYAGVLAAVERAVSGSVRPVERCAGRDVPSGGGGARHG